MYCQSFLFGGVTLKVSILESRDEFAIQEFTQIDRHVSFQKTQDECQEMEFLVFSTKLLYLGQGVAQGDAFSCRRGGTSNPFHGNDSDSHSELAKPWGWVERVNLIGKKR